MQSCFLSFACTPCCVRAHHAIMCMHTMPSCARTPHCVCAHHAVVCMHTTLCVCTPRPVRAHYAVLCTHTTSSCAHHTVVCTNTTSLCAHHTIMCTHTMSCMGTPHHRVHAHNVVHTTPWCAFQSNLTPKSCDHSSQPIRRLHSLKSL